MPPLNHREEYPAILARSVRLLSLPWTRERTRPRGAQGAGTMMMCSEYMQQIRLFEMAEREFHHAQTAMMCAIKYDEAKDRTRKPAISRQESQRVPRCPQVP